MKFYGNRYLSICASGVDDAWQASTDTAELVRFSGLSPEKRPPGGGYRIEGDVGVYAKGLHGRRLRAVQNGLWLVDKVDCGFDYENVRREKAFSRGFGRSSVLNRLHDTEGNWPDVKVEFCESPSFGSVLSLGDQQCDCEGMDAATAMHEIAGA